MIGGLLNVCLVLASFGIASTIVGPLKAGEAPNQSEFAMECRYAGKLYDSGAIAPALNSRLKLKEFKESKKNSFASSGGDDEGGGSSSGTKGKKDKKKKKSSSKSKETPWQTGVAVTNNEPESPWKATVDPSSGKTVGAPFYVLCTAVFGLEFAKGVVFCLARFDQSSIVLRYQCQAI